MCMAEANRQKTEDVEVTAPAYPLISVRAMLALLEPRGVLRVIQRAFFLGSID